jgi:hypothetical protein
MRNWPNGEQKCQPLNKSVNPCCKRGILNGKWPIITITCLAGEEGLEPPTPGFGVRLSGFPAGSCFFFCGYNRLITKAFALHPCSGAFLALPSKCLPGAYQGRKMCRTAAYLKDRLTRSSVLKARIASSYGTTPLPALAFAPLPRGGKYALRSIDKPGDRGVSLLVSMGA